MNTKETGELHKLHDKISCVDNKLDTFLTNEWVHMVKKVTGIEVNIAWLKRLSWVIIGALVGLLFKAYI